MNVHRLAFLFSASLCLCGASVHAASAVENAKNVALIKQYYQDALQSYAAGDYRAAVVKWTAILREDPDQKSAQSMILEARERINLLTKKRRQRAFEYIRLAQYRKAAAELQVLLDQDPGDPQLTTLQSRLQNVMKTAPRLSPTSKPSRAAILGLKGYLTLPPDLKLAHDGLRYACEIAPREEVYKNLLRLLYTDYPGLETEDAVTPGMKLLEYKHQVALHQIYDAKYHLAVLTLNQILALEPDDGLALKRVGSAYYSLKRMDEARAAWTAALKLSPGNKTLQKFLAKIDRPRRKSKPKSE
jgi:Flp pilus assembly protein TadD